MSDRSEHSGRCVCARATLNPLLLVLLPVSEQFFYACQDPRDTEVRIEAVGKLWRVEQ